MDAAAIDVAATGTGPPNRRAYLYRRAVLEYFRRGSSEAASVEDLAAAVDEREEPEADRDRAAIRLHHSILPRLADAGVLDYDARTTTVRCRDPPPAGRP